jgi:hypothetical protein
MTSKWLKSSLKSGPLSIQAGEHPITSCLVSGFILILLGHRSGHTQRGKIISMIYIWTVGLTPFCIRIGIDKFFAILPYGDEWRAHRRMFQQYFGPRRVSRELERNERMLRFVRRGLLPNLLTSPKDFREHLKKSVAPILSCFASGLGLLIPIAVLAAFPYQ